MRLTQAVDQFIDDMRSEGRINSDRTETAYRAVLARHAEDVSERDPRTTNRDDIKRTLNRWPNPNTRRCSRAVLVSFYDWAMEEGHRKDNPARQTRRPKRRPTNVYRLTRNEAAALLAAAQDPVEQRAIGLGICAGLRSAELRGLQGRHFDRAGFIWVSPDIAKGGRERWVPVIAELAGTVQEIRANVARAHHVLPGTHRGGWGANAFQRSFPERPMSSQTLQRLVARVAKRAGIGAHIHPHLMRHAFADHVARLTGIRVAQAALGHADISTTQGYVDAVSLDELALSFTGLGYARGAPPAQAGREPPDGEGGIRTRDHAAPSARAQNDEQEARDGPAAAHGPPPHHR